MNEYICSLCPRNCNAKRTETTGKGVCGIGTLPVLARAALHFDEEPVISGTNGSGAIFFSGCALKCVFCQNYEISHHNYGSVVTIQRLREICDELIAQGAHNINLVNPTHFTPAIIKCFTDDPLSVPLIWNCGGYEKVETLRTLEGLVDVYLPDLKYMLSDSARKYSAAPDYYGHAIDAIREMVRQTGPVQIDENGLITRGTIIRHLILPGCVNESIELLKVIRSEFPDAWISLMAQYLPFGKAHGIDELGRRLTQEEYDRVAEALDELGFEDGFVQELSSSDECYIPVFDLTGVHKE